MGLMHYLLLTCLCLHWRLFLCLQITSKLCPHLLGKGLVGLLNTICLQVVSVKVIRNKQTGQVEGYGFIEFTSHGAAERILQTYNGTPMPNGEQNFRLNWASFSGGDKRDDTPDFTIFVGDLAADVTDYQLQETFRVRYPSVKGAKVVIDRLTGRTKGYGFVRFGDESEQVRAMTEMNGAFCSTRPMRIGLATNKKAVAGQQYTKGTLICSDQCHCS